MNRNDFVSIVPRIKVWETKLLNKSFYDKLIDTNSVDESLKILQETSYGADITKTNYEKVLEKSYEDVCSDLNKSIESNDFINLICVRNDYHNIKALIKAKILNKDFSSILSNNGALDVEKIKSAVKSEDYREIPEVFGIAIRDAFSEYENTQDPQMIDVVLDRNMFEHMKVIANNLQCDFIDKYVNTLIDVTNLKTVFRLKRINKDKDFVSKVLINGGSLDIDVCLNLLKEPFENIANKLSCTAYADLVRSGIDKFIETKSLSSFEKSIDDYLMEFVRQAKFVSFGIEPVFAYLYAKEIEVKNLRIILAGKSNNVDSNTIKERLRENYV